MSESRTEEGRMKGLKIIGRLIAIISIAIISMGIGAEMTKNKIYPKTDITILAVDSLTDWQIMELALIEVESENDSTAVSSKNARGILQLTPVYVAEYNRITGESLCYMDAHDNITAMQCFDLIQRYYNPNGDIETAIRLHNPKAGAWYLRRVLRKMDEIKTREMIRKQITTFQKKTDSEWIEQ